MPSSIEFRHGAIELLLLKAMSWGPQHGFSIARWIQDTADDVLRLEEGSMYPTLHRMEDKGLVKATRGPGGGFQLLKSPDEILLGDVNAVDRIVPWAKDHGETADRVVAVDPAWSIDFSAVG